MKTALQLFTFPAPSSRGCCNRQASRMQVRAWARYRSGCYRTHRPAPGVTRRGAADSSPAAARPALRRRGVTKPHPAWKLKINPAGQPMGLLMGWFCRSGSPKPLPARLPDTLWAMNSMLRNTHEPKAYAFLYINVRIWKSRAGRSTPPCTPRTGRAGQARGWGGGGGAAEPGPGGRAEPGGEAGTSAAPRSPRAAPRRPSQAKASPPPPPGPGPARPFAPVRAAPSGSAPPPHAAALTLAAARDPHHRPAPRRLLPLPAAAPPARPGPALRRDAKGRGLPGPPRQGGGRAGMLPVSGAGRPCWIRGDAFCVNSIVNFRRIVAYGLPKTISPSSPLCAEASPLTQGCYNT